MCDLSETCYITHSAQIAHAFQCGDLQPRDQAVLVNEMSVWYLEVPQRCIKCHWDVRNGSCTHLLSSTHPHPPSVLEGYINKGIFFFGRILKEQSHGCHSILTFLLASWILTFHCLSQTCLLGLSVFGLSGNSRGNWCQQGWNSTSLIGTTFRKDMQMECLIKCPMRTSLAQWACVWVCVWENAEPHIGAKQSIYCWGIQWPRLPLCAWIRSEYSRWSTGASFAFFHSVSQEPGGWESWSCGDELTWHFSWNCITFHKTVRCVVTHFHANCA